MVSQNEINHDIFRATKCIIRNTENSWGDFLLIYLKREAINQWEQCALYNIYIFIFLNLVQERVLALLMEIIQAYPGYCRIHDQIRAFTDKWLVRGTMSRNQTQTQSIRRKEDRWDFVKEEQQIFLEDPILLD